MRGAEPPVAHLDPDGEPDRVLDAVPAPGRADAALDSSDRLAIRMAALEAGRDQLGPDLRKAVHRRPEEVDALTSRDLGVEAVFPATVPKTMSFSGVISPPGTRGTTEYRPPRWMLARKRSLVSCSVAWAASRTFSFQIVAMIEATAGLQISQPCPRPCDAIRSSNVRICLIIAI